MLNFAGASSQTPCKPGANFLRLFTVFSPAPGKVKVLFQELHGLLVITTTIVEDAQIQAWATRRRQNPRVTISSGFPNSHSAKLHLFSASRWDVFRCWGLFETSAMKLYFTLWDETKKERIHAGKPCNPLREKTLAKTQLRSQIKAYQRALQILTGW